MSFVVRRMEEALRPDFHRLHSERNGIGWCHCVAWWVDGWEDWGDRTADENELYEALATIYLSRAADRARQEANEILAALFTGDELQQRLDEVGGWLPLPVGLIDRRACVARAVLKGGGLPKLS